MRKESTSNVACILQEIRLPHYRGSVRTLQEITFMVELFALMAEPEFINILDIDIRDKFLRIV